MKRRVSDDLLAKYSKAMVGHDWWAIALDLHDERTENERLRGIVEKRWTETAATLTPKQLRVLRFAEAFRAEHGFSPTLGEIAAAMGVSKVTIFEHLRTLERKGAITRKYHQARSIMLVPEAAEAAREGGVANQ